MLSCFSWVCVCVHGCVPQRYSKTWAAHISTSEPQRGGWGGGGCDKVVGGRLVGGEVAILVVVLLLLLCYRGNWLWHIIDCIEPMRTRVCTLCVVCIHKHTNTYKNIHIIQNRETGRDSVALASRLPCGPSCTKRFTRAFRFRRWHSKHTSTSRPFVCYVIFI